MRSIGRGLLAFFLSLALAHCGSGIFLFFAPTDLRYSANPVVYPVGLPISPNLPVSEEPIDSFRIEPALPEGLKMDPKTGAIAGTPLSASPEREYRITAENAVGKFSSTVRLGVSEAAVSPGRLSYRSAIAAVRGLAMTPEIPTSSGGAITHGLTGLALRLVSGSGYRRDLRHSISHLRQRRLTLAQLYGDWL